jgi:hypothetical protein
LSADLLADHLKAEQIDHEAEYRFGAIASGGAGKGLRGRLKDMGLKDWRADFHIIGHMLLVEVEGGAWTGGRHTTGVGFSNDLAKYDAAMRLGFTVYRCSPEMVKKGHAIETIKQLIALKTAAQ